MSGISRAELAIGTRIYYKGDMANLSGFGSVIAHREATNYSPWSVDIELEDGRKMRGIWVQNFGRGERGGYRFLLASDYEADQRRRFEAFLGPRPA